MLVLLAFSVATIIVYPMADGLKVHGAGSDEDDALILAGKAITHFENPYTQLTYLSGSIHPGAGWALLAAPFSVTGLYSLFFSFTLMLALGTLRVEGLNWKSINLFMLFLASSLFVWELAVVGSDWLPFSMLILVLMLRLLRPSLNTKEFVGLTIVLGLLSTFRLVFILLPMLVGFCLYFVHPSRALGIALGSIAICVIIHVFFYVLNAGVYPPLLIQLQETKRTFAFGGLATAIAVCVAAGVVMWEKRRTWSPISLFTIGLGVPWTTVALTGLTESGEFSHWGYSTFLALPLPFVLLVLTSSQTARQSN
jgi:hypothetical protein